MGVINYDSLQIQIKYKVNIMHAYVGSVDNHYFSQEGQHPAVRLAEVADAAFGGLAEELEDEFDDRRVVVEEAEQVDHAAKDGLKEVEQLMHGRHVNALDHAQIWN